MKRLSIIFLLLSVVVFFTASQMKASDTTTQSEEVKLEQQLAALHVKLENVSTPEEYNAVILEVKQILSSQAQGTTYNCGVTLLHRIFPLSVTMQQHESLPGVLQLVA